MTESPVPRRRQYRPARQPFWVALPERELLQLRLKDLNVSIEGTWLEQCVRELNDELKAKGILAQAHAWISDEWFSPDNTPGISIPFYLAHPRLMRLEKKMMLDVEGGSRRECLQILRHEAGHVIQHAFALHRRKRWQAVFGASSKPYPSSYRPNPASKNFVQHLPRWYGQSHPDEDFAETFAVWLTPRSNWRKKYADWPALEKLEYVDELMREIAGQKPGLTKRVKVDPVSRLTITLGEHYRKKRMHYAVDSPGALDRDLGRLFKPYLGHETAPSASAFIRRNREKIRKMLADLPEEYLLTLDAVLDDMIDRCRILNLRAIGAQSSLRLQIAKLITKNAVHSLYSSSRRQRFAV